MNIHGRGFGDYTHTPMLPLTVGHRPTKELTRRHNIECQIYARLEQWIHVRWTRPHAHSRIHALAHVAYVCGRCTASALKIHCWAVCVLSAESSLWFLFSLSSSNAQLKSVSLSYFKRTVTNREFIPVCDQCCVSDSRSEVFVSSLFRRLRMYSAVRI